MTGRGLFQLNSVAGPAVKAHVAHGDAQPGQAIPGLAGYEFDGGCESVPIERMEMAPSTVCALDAGNTMYCWGGNDRAQLGFPPPPSGPFPVSLVPVLAGVQGFVRLASGVSDHLCGITSSGDARCWGRGGFGQIGAGSPGSLGPNPPATVVGGTSWLRIARGRLSTCGVSTSGAGLCWGSNQRGEIGNANVPVSPSANGSPVTVDGGLVFKTISKGFLHACGIATDGQAYCWGFNQSGELGIGSTDAVPHQSPVAVATSERFIQISVGGASTCAVTVDHRAFCWGANLTGQLGDGTQSPQASPTAVSTNLHFSYIVTTSNAQPTSPQFGRAHTCALTADGVPYCWGLNDAGQLGNGTTSPIPQLTPVPVAGNHTLTSIATGEQSTCGMRGGAIWCWGQNLRGQLGNGTLLNSSTPVAVGSPFAGP